MRKIKIKLKNNHKENKNDKRKKHIFFLKKLILKHKNSIKTQMRNIQNYQKVLII